jgi:UDP-N-acetyl-2-amino-2-deoxyglucuronate dehydrogenase
MATTGFGIVGCGMIANFHAEAIKHIKGAKLVACCSSRREAADKFAAANPGTKVYGKLDDMLADGNVQIVIVCTPSGAHLELA